MHRIRPTVIALFAAALIGVLALAGCRSNAIKADLATPVQPIQRNPVNAKIKLTIGAKNFTEQLVLGQLYAQALRAASYRVTTRFNYPDEQAAYAALKSGQISGYPEYTSTALLSFFHVDSADIPKNQLDAYIKAKQRFAAAGIAALPPTPFSSSNALAMTEARHRVLGYDSIAQLSAKTGSLTLAGAPECATRQDCLPGLEHRYGLKFKKFIAVPPAERHRVLFDGRADFSIVYTTDPQIASKHLFVLDDPEAVFPPGNATFIIKKQTLAAAGPDLAKTIDAVSRRLTVSTMRRLNAEVDLQGKPPSAVAAEYLRSAGYIKRG